MPRDIVALTTALEAETGQVDRVAPERLPRGVIEKPRESDATRILVVGTNVLGGEKIIGWEKGAAKERSGPG